MRVSILGMGQMGRAFATKALERGYHVTVWNRSPGRARDLVAKGAVEAPSPEAASLGADVVLAVLADDTAVLEVCLGGKGNGVLAALGPQVLFANLSTVSPDTARRLAAAGPDGRVLDAPVMGSPPMIASGRGRFYIGGPVEAIASVGSLWEDLGAGYVHCGPVGSGATMKIIFNLLLISGVAALAEGVATARRCGVSDDLLRAVLADSPVMSPSNKLRLEGMLDSDHPGWFSPQLARKDLRLAIALARETGIGVRLGPAAEELLTRVIEMGPDWPDFSAVIEAIG